MELQLEGLHGLWEMVVNKEHHTDITDTQLQGLLDAVLHNDIQCAAVATAAIWTMAAAAKARTSLLERGVSGAMARSIATRMEKSVLAGAHLMGHSVPCPEVWTQRLSLHSRGPTTLQARLGRFLTLRCVRRRCYPPLYKRLRGASERKIRARCQARGRRLATW